MTRYTRDVRPSHLARTGTERKTLCGYDLRTRALRLCDWREAQRATCNRCRKVANL